MIPNRWHWYAAMAARGDRAGVTKEQAAFEAARKGVPADVPWGMQNKAVEVLAMDRHKRG